MTVSTLDLFWNDSENDDVIADEFAVEFERRAAELEITVDYYLMEFV